MPPKELTDDEFADIARTWSRADQLRVLRAWGFSSHKLHGEELIKRLVSLRKRTRQLMAKQKSVKKNPLVKGYSKASISENVSEMITGGYPPARAVAAALKMARAAFKKKFPGKALPLKLKKPNPVERKKINDAVSLYRKFTGMHPKFIKKIRVKARPKIMLAIGPCDGILYSTVRDGGLEEYIHKFKKGSRPLLCSSPDGKQLFLIGGSYDFTQDGIVDK